MTCRHGDDDPTCGSYLSNVNAAKALIAKHEARLGVATTPDAAKFEIEEVEEVGPHLVVKAKYPNCAKCSYEGSKVMVFLNTPLKAAVMWRTIDPHFREPEHTPSKSEAPSPAARFPASSVGWDHAVRFARAQVTSHA